MRYFILAVAFLFASCSSKSSLNNGNASTGSGKVRLTWTAPAGDVQGYYVEQAVGTGNFNLVGNVTAPTTAITLSNLVKGTKYVFRVRAYTPGGTSGYSLSASATP